MVGPAKTAEPIKMPFGLWARMGPRNCVRWGPDRLWEGAILSDRGAHGKVLGLSAKAVQKRLTDRFAVWVVDSGGSKEAPVQLYSPGGASVPSWEGILAPLGGYD